MDKAKLIAGLKRGDYDSYKALFGLYYARFVHFAQKLTGDRQAAKDLVQEAFMKVWTNRDKLNETLSIEDYLFILVKRAAINFIRDRKFAETLTQELGERIGGDASSDRPAETRDLIRSIHTCVEKMPPQRRKVFLMSRRESLSNKEIAQKLSLSEKTVERHITLALTDLRKKHLS